MPARSPDASSEDVMLTRLRRLPLLALVLVVGLVMQPAVLAWGQEAAGSMPVSPQMPHIAHIHKGECGRLVPSPLATLADVAAPATAAGAHPVMVSQPTSERVVYLTLDELVSDTHAVAVHYPEEIIRDAGLLLADSYVACGEVGGTRLPDGSLAIALHEQNASGYVGIAHLVPNPDAEDQMLMTLVTIYLVPPLPDALPVATPERG
jgi:hypothetical protein